MKNAINKPSPATRDEAKKNSCAEGASLFLSLRGVFIILTAVMLFTGIRLLSSAQGAPADSAASDATEESSVVIPLPDRRNSCVTAMKPILIAKNQELADFFADHFQSDKPTTELLPKAVDRYRIFRQEVRKEMDRLLAPQDNKTATVANQERGPCQDAVNEDFDIMKEMLRAHITKNAYAKKSTRLMDSYRRINEKLVKLNFTIAQTYGNFAALSQRLPCYADRCVKK